MNNPILVSISLLTLSNVFMTFAWYAHLKDMNQKPWIIAALLSWGIALFEYLLQVPANRIGYTVLSVGQLMPQVRAMSNSKCTTSARPSERPKPWAGGGASSRCIEAVLMRWPCRSRLQLHR